MVLALGSQFHPSAEYALRLRAVLLHRQRPLVGTHVQNAQPRHSASESGLPSALGHMLG